MFFLSKNSSPRVFPRKYAEYKRHGEFPGYYSDSREEKRQVQYLTVDILIKVI